MSRDSENGAPQYLTTKEVADLLRVRERKVYDLAAAGDIPHRRITGKLLFPRNEIHDWIEGTDTSAKRERPAVLTGSHDPLLDWAVRESGCGLATLLNGSLDGLDRFADGDSALTGLHVPDADGWNIHSVSGQRFVGSVLIAWARRRRGLLVSEAAKGSIRSIADLRNERVVLRQKGAGAATLLKRLLVEAGLTEGDLAIVPELARTESDAAATVAAGDADAALGIEAMARRFSLPFVPLLDEQFDLLVDRRSYFTQPVQTLLAFARSETLHAKAGAMGGYMLDDLGQVRWISA